MKRNLSYIAILICLLSLGVTACDETIHEYPRTNEVLVMVELNADRTPPLYYKGLIYDETGNSIVQELPHVSAMPYVPDERLCVRFIVELYKLPSAGASVDKGILVDRREFSVDRLAQPPQDTLAFQLPQGYYRVLSWADYAPEVRVSEWHFDTQQLNAVRENIDHTPMVNHHKNAAAGSCDFSVTVGRYGEEISVSTPGSTATATPSGVPLVPVYMERPSARFHLWATDWNEFSKKRSRASVNNLLVRVVYKQYVGVGYNVESGMLNAFIESRTMEMMPPDEPSGGEVLLAYDYVLANDGREDHVLVDIFIYNTDGEEINHYQNVDIPLYRNHETVLRGPFLTKKIGSGNIGIDDDFDDEFVVVIPD